MQLSTSRGPLWAALLFMAATPAGLCAEAVPADEAEAAPAESIDSSLQEVVVTARRIEERNQDVPIAITAFSTEQLRQQHINEAMDLQALVPSLIVGQNGQGIRDTPTFTMRGQGSTFEGSPGVVVYMNEVPLPAPITLSNQGAPGQYLDLASLQALAGPQGTLFGRNTTGGAVLLTPNKPKNTFEGYIQGGYGNYNDRETEGVVNVPIVPDRLKVRLAIQTKDRRGYTKDVNWDVYRDDTHYDTIRFGMDFTPTDSIDNYTMATWTNSHNHGPGTINQAVNTGTILTPGSILATNAFLYGLTGGFLGCNPATGAADAVSCVNGANYYNAAANKAKALGPRATALDLNEFGYQRTWGVTNTTKFDLSDKTAIRNIASYQNFKQGYALDADGTTLPQYNTGVNGFSELYPRDDFRTITEELQLQGTTLADALTYTVGAFYFDQATNGPQRGDAIDYCFYTLIVSQNCDPVALPSYFTEKSKSEAVYAQGTYSLGQLTPVLNRVKLTLGYRRTWDQIDGFSSYDNGFSGHLSSAAPSWTAGLDYKLTDDVLTYAKVSRGYKAGGFNTFAVYPNTHTFGPEYDTTYEIGIKTEGHLGEQPFRVNFDGYRTNYSRIQRAAGDYNPVTNQNGAVNLSSASAVIQGIELDADFKLTRDLEFGLIYSYTDAYYTRFPYTPNVVGLDFAGYVDCDGKPWTAGSELNLKCRPLQYISPHIGSAHLRYTLPLPLSIGEVSAFVNYSVQAKQHTEALFGSQQPHELLASFSLVDLSIDWKDMFGKPIDLNLFGTNLTNKLYRTTNSDVYQSVAVSSTLYGEPRMYGFRVRYHWGR
jgi:iron complex outermembrane receptor protein